MVPAGDVTSSLRNPLKPLALVFLAFQDACVLSTAQKYLPFYLPLGRSPWEYSRIHSKLEIF